MTRVIEDENGVWRLQSRKDPSSNWEDELRVNGEDWPYDIKVGNGEYGIKVLNMSSVLKAVFKAGKETI